MIYDPSITYTKSMGVPALKRAAISKGELEGWQTSQIQLKRKDVNLLAYLNEDKWFDGWGEKKPAKVKKPVSARPTAGKSNTSATEFQYDLLSGITTPAPANVEPSSMLPPHPGSSPIPATEPISAVEVVDVPKEPLVVTGITGEPSSPVTATVPKVSYEPIVTTVPKVSLVRNRRDREKSGSSTPDEKLMNMWSKVTMEEMRHPAWHCLNKSEMLVLMVCKIEASNAAYKKKKDSTGVPFFTFTHYNAKTFYDISSPTFSKSIKRLMDIGFIEISKSSGIFNGKGTMQEYRLSGKWKRYSSSGRRYVANNGNLQKARDKRKEIQLSEK